MLWKLPASHKNCFMLNLQQNTLHHVLHVVQLHSSVPVTQFQAKPQVNCWPYRCKLDSGVYMQWCKKHLHNSLSIRRAVYIDSCQQITRAKTIPTFHMLMHSNILPSFQIDVNKSLEGKQHRHTRDTGEWVCVRFSEFSQVTCPPYNLTDAGQIMVSALYVTILWQWRPEMTELTFNGFNCDVTARLTLISVYRGYVIM